jgi:long-chain acyl-CoA synthetase
LSAPHPGSTTTPAVALEDGVRAWSRAEMEREQLALVGVLAQHGTRVLATVMDNGAAWVIADGAAARAGMVHVPLPAFFTPQQLRHALASAGVDTVLVPSPSADGLAVALGALTRQPCELAGERHTILRLATWLVSLPDGTAKITFTSGTTGTPKGVCLSRQTMDAVARRLGQAMAGLAIRRHLCALPLAVLLENIAGVLAPLAQGATCVLPPLAELGWSGSSGFDVARFHECVLRQRPDSIILLPQMLRAWVGWLQQNGRSAPESLRFAAVGGAAVGERLLRSARALGIPAYEGYGLSEGASVQTLNLPGADRPGSAGRPLPHARVRIAADGEIEIAGSLMAGYLGDDRPPPDWWPTGDLGSIDADGFVHVQGRKKHVLITAFGRNVSPEWVEQALRSEPAVAQAVVFGDGEPALSAVLWPARADASDAALQAALDAANGTLPDYARVRRWVRARAAFTPQAGMATPNGRPLRAAILQSHPDALALAAPVSHQ